MWRLILLVGMLLAMPANAQTITAAVLGDSQSPVYGGWSSMLPSNFHMVNASTGGARCDQLDDDLTTWYASNSADVVLVQCGVNDIHVEQTPASTVEDIEVIVALAVAEGDAAVVVTPPPLASDYGGTPGNIADMGTLASLIVASGITNGYSTIDAYTGFMDYDAVSGQDIDDLIKDVDGLHLEKSGHALFSDIVNAELETLYPDNRPVFD